MRYIKQIKFGRNGERYSLSSAGGVCKNDDYENYDHCIEQVNSIQTDQSGNLWVEKIDSFRYIPKIYDYYWVNSVIGNVMYYEY